MLNCRCVMQPPSPLALELPGAPPSEVPVVPPPLVLIGVPEEVDQVVGTLYRWMTEGAQKENSYAGTVDIAGGTKIDLVENYVKDYLTILKINPRRLVVIIVVGDEHAQESRRRLQKLSEEAAVQCGKKGAFRSQIDFRLMTISRIQSHFQVPTRSPLKSVFS